MTEEKHTFDALENIKRWCEALSCAYVPKAINSGMLALMVELECANEKYGRMRKRFAGNLPKNVTVREFEDWLDWLCNKKPDFESLFRGRTMDERIAADEDLARLSMKPEDIDSIPDTSWKPFVSAQGLDNAVTASILEKFHAVSPNDRSVEESEVTGALGAVDNLQYVICNLIEDKMETLECIIRDIIFQLEYPSDQALRNVLRHYWKPYAADKKAGREHVKLEVHRFFYDHQAHRNYRELLDREAEKAKNRLLQNLEQWNIDPEDLIRNGRGEALMIDEREAGLAIYRRMPDLCREPKLLKELTECFEFFIRWRMHRKERLRLDDASIMAKPASPQLSPQKAFKVSTAWKCAFCGRLTSNPDACAKLQETLRTVSPNINKGRGKQSERKNWIHVYHAWMQLKLLKSNCIAQSFAEAVNAVCPDRSVGSITKTFSDKGWEEKHLKDSDRDRIAELVTLFLPVRDLLDGAESHADFQKR